MHDSYKECICCSLPYIDEVNGRDGRCDFCTNFVLPVTTEGVVSATGKLLAATWNRSEPV